MHEKYDNNLNDICLESLSVLSQKFNECLLPLDLNTFMK